MAETILIVDDEESVRRTFHDWLTASGLDCEVYAVADAESALVFANQQTVDLAILDWNLGSGSDGLQLLEDLVEFHPDLVAILVTGFAHQATPLDALRLGVRDYLDKNQDLNRESFLAAVRKQLERIVPAKRHRQFMRTLREFRESVEKILPLVQSSAAMNERVPLPDAIRSLFRYLMRTTQASSGVLIARHTSADGEQIFRAFDSDGEQLAPPSVPFERSLAASVASMQEPCAMKLRDPAVAGSLEFQQFERDRREVLAAPIQVTPTTLVVLELFDKANGQAFGETDRQMIAAASDFGAELLRQAMGERQTRRVLFEAVEAALKASSTVVETLPPRADAPTSTAVLDKLKESMSASGGGVMDAESSVRLAEAVRCLAVRHGPAAVKHCITLVESLRKLLDEITGA